MNCFVVASLSLQGSCIQTLLGQAQGLARAKQGLYHCTVAKSHGGSKLGEILPGTPCLSLLDKEEKAGNVAAKNLELGHNCVPW